MGEGGRMKRFAVSIILLISTLAGYSQIYTISNDSYRERRVESRSAQKTPEKLYAEQFARERGIPIRLRYENGTLLELRKISASGVPRYLKTFNLDAANTISTDKLWGKGGLGLTLSGEGIVVGVWDGGPILSSHAEFDDRVRLVDKSDDPEFHATHVAGTIAATGIREDARGMANGALIDGYEWNNDNGEMRAAAKDGMLISNHSYGYVHGWDYNSELERWEWYGEELLSKTEDFNFGLYGEDARIWDEISFQNPRYLIVTSAGNDRGEGPSAGTSHFVWTSQGWTESTTVRDLDGNNSYDCIGTQSTSKNILVVGAADDIDGGYSDSVEVDLAGFSVFGPTDDGRIKPDIVGNGIGLMSTSNSGSGYGISSGTSMSSPNVAGSLALLQEHYYNLNEKYMYAAMLKAIVLHTADDAGPAGPDYQYGWGLMNTASAVNIISRQDTNTLFHDALIDSTELEYDFFSTGQDEIKVTVVWTDPPGEVPGRRLNPTDRNLVNDLDIRLERVLDGFQFKPFKMNPMNPSELAEMGDNSIDNVEQILIEKPTKGKYILRISHKFELENGRQAFDVVVNGMTKEYVAGGLIEKTAANGQLLITSAKNYANDMDAQWRISPENGLPVSLYFDTIMLETDADFLRIYDGDSSTAPLLAEITGTWEAANTSFVSTGGAMYVTFNSNSSINENNFDLRYCTVAPEGEYLIEGIEYPCINTNNPFFAVGEEGTQYEWSSADDWEFTSKSSNAIDLMVENGESSIEVTPYNNCGAGEKVQKHIKPLDAAPVLESLVGDTLPCSDVPSEYIAEFYVGASYAWKMPREWDGGGEAAEVILIPKKVSGDLIVRAMNACGVSNDLTVFIDVLDVPAEEVIRTEKNPPCAWDTQLFWVDTKPDYSYEWSVQSNWELLGESDNDTLLIQVGDVSGFVEVQSTNKCGVTETSKLYQVSNIPPAPQVDTSTNEFGYTVFQISNMNAYYSVQWYLDGLEFTEVKVPVDSLLAFKNGVYTVNSISDKLCVNVMSAEDGIEIKEEELTFVAYRLNESTVIIENTLDEPAGVNIISAFGKVQYIGELQPGYNEIPFREQGMFLIQLFDFGSKIVLKTYL